MSPKILLQKEPAEANTPKSVFQLLPSFFENTTLPTDQLMSEDCCSVQSYIAAREQWALNDFLEGKKIVRAWRGRFPKMVNFPPETVSKDSYPQSHWSTDISSIWDKKYMRDEHCCCVLPNVALWESINQLSLYSESTVYESIHVNSCFSLSLEVYWEQFKKFCRTCFGFYAKKARYCFPNWRKRANLS